MIILDTNVVSEPMRPRSDPRVVSWIDRQPAEELYLTATGLSELLLGVELLPESSRKTLLTQALDEILMLFEARVLPFDEDAAVAYAVLVGKARRQGHAISVGDGQIAAVAAIHGFAVATRDTSPFAGVGVEVINPWEA